MSVGGTFAPSPHIISSRSDCYNMFQRLEVKPKKKKKIPTALQKTIFISPSVDSFCQKTC